ncbi:MULTISPECIES: DUF4037 domain-containing protein [Psychrilyobacter]|uniref:DUF4037 domain-containing protein n=1 Tax=Psychrilyobacter piezotolerans TaxID=2293438 RepID=A0ABX9KEZ8_9FUSO|nr:MULTISPECIES: DUF4037 domain-containing protein [Psychrilyobacter]MCS5422516.1 DUF4037 domain-containing protein [Psychrilyobacter sp. S5]NDI78744.1 DUF4037 domain-containing protein [Psychrilyobacter piezotolerans]RDE59592.1 DUF4037 domain-containing protein [Psychrilyobacter sp. S5]REI40006.1 DUF4037 domain-containing protein [Psychrilyobacter piezotolerans]
MNKYDGILLELVDDFSKYESVDGVLLSGSRTTPDFDKDSDYDLYIYSKGEIPLDFRKKIADKYFNYAELDNTTWEREDQGFFRGNGVQVDIVYRDVEFIERVLEEIVIKCTASTGYSTCFWANFIKSDILYDRDGKLENLQKKFDIEYPEELRKNIVSKNFPLLNKIIPAYTNQIEKALKRNDILSVNHRISAFFESYFDIIFAINMKLHPGEKKLLKITKEQLDHTPENMETDIRELFENLYKREFDIVDKLNVITGRLESLLKELNLIF